MRKLIGVVALGAWMSLAVAQDTAVNFQYKLKENQQERYQATVEMSGNLPIPGAAGMAGVLKLNMTVFMKTTEAKEQAFTVSTGLEAFDAEFNGQPFPVGLDMAKSVIPDSTATVSPDGKLGGIKGGGGLMGFQLPGFDPRNMATMLIPTEFPTDKPLTPGTSWQFTRTFGEGQDALKITLNAKVEGFEEVEGTKLLKVTQTFDSPIEAYQDAFYQPTTDKENAVRVTKGQMKGTMTLWYHPEDGILHKAVLQASLNQTTEPIKRDGSEIKDYERESTQLNVNATVTRQSSAKTETATSS